MNLPNKITLIRVLFIPLFIIALLNNEIPYNNYIAAVIFIIASITDFLDGYLARKYKLVTNFGKFMDPLADKLLVCTALICFVAIPNNPMPAWVVIVIISREFIISGFRLVAVDNGIVIAASYVAKAKTFVQMVMSIVLIVNFDNPIVNAIEYVLIYTSLILTVISLMEYLYKNRDVLNDTK